MGLYEDAGTKYFYEETDEGIVVMKVETDAVKLDVPGEIAGKPIVAIMSDAFAECENLEDVSFPDELEAIDDDDFVDEDEDFDEESEYDEEDEETFTSVLRDVFMEGPENQDEDLVQNICKLVKAAYEGCDPDAELKEEDEDDGAFLLREFLDIVVEEAPSEVFLARVREFMALDFYKSLPDDEDINFDDDDENYGADPDFDEEEDA